MFKWIKNLLGIDFKESVQESAWGGDDIETETVSSDHHVDYSTMTKNELLEEAKNKNIPVKSSMKKKEIIDLLNKA